MERASTNIVEKCKYVTLRHFEKTSVTQMYHRRGSGAKPLAVGQFFVISGKKSYFNVIESHFAHV